MIASTPTRVESHGLFVCGLGLLELLGVPAGVPEDRPAQVVARVVAQELLQLWDRPLEVAALVARHDLVEARLRISVTLGLGAGQPTWRKAEVLIARAHPSVGSGEQTTGSGSVDLSMAHASASSRQLGPVLTRNVLPNSSEEQHHSTLVTHATAAPWPFLG